jgi:hypothetical protein
LLEAYRSIHRYLDIYSFGVEQIAVRLFFRNDSCIKAELVSREDRLAYGDWRTEEIKRFAVGQTLNAILNREGPATSVKNNQDVSRAGTSTPLVLTYVAGRSYSVELTIENGVCKTAECFMLAH